MGLVVFLLSPTCINSDFMLVYSKEAGFIPDQGSASPILV